MHHQRTMLQSCILIVSFLALIPFAESFAQGFRQMVPSQRPFNGALLNRDASAADGYYRLGVENLTDPSNSDRAVDHLERAVELDGTNAEFHYMLAEAYMANFQYAGLVQMPFIAPKVKTQLELAVQYNPKSVTYREALLRYYVFAPAILGGSYRKAHDEAVEIGRIDPYMGMLAQAGVFSEEGEEEKALTLYSRAIRMRPNSWQAYQRLGEHYLANEEIDNAITMFEQHVAVAPEQALGYKELGQGYQKKQMYADAINAFQKSLEKDPSQTPLVFRIAQLMEFKGEKSLARAQYQKYLSMVPSGRAADDARLKIRELPN